MQNKNYIFKFLPISLYAWLVCLLGAIFYCYEYFLRITPSVMARELMSDYHLCATQFGNLVASYYYIYTPMQLFVGLLLDRYGPRRLLTLACLSCAVGAYLFTSQILWLAYFGRMLIGFGSAFAFVGALKLASTWLPPNRFGLVSGSITCLGMIGAMMGDATLGHLVNAIGWRYTINVSAIAGAILMVVLFIFVRDRNPWAHNLSQSQIVYHDHPANYRELFAGLRLVVQNKNVWFAGAIGCCLFLGITAFAELWGVSYAKSLYSLDNVAAGRMIFLVFLGWAIGGPLVGMLSDWLEARQPILLWGSVLSCLLMCLILYVPGWTIRSVSILFFLFGFCSSVQVLIFAVAREVCSKEITGTALAFANMLTMVGGMLFQPLIGKLLDVCWDGTMVNNVRFFSINDYKIALSVLPIGLLLATVLSALIKESYPKKRFKLAKK